MRTIFAVTFAFALICASASAQIDPDLVNLSLPDLDWAVQFRIHDWHVDGQEIGFGFSGRSFQAHDSVTGMLLSVEIDPATAKLNGPQYRDRWAKTLETIGPGLLDLKKYDSGGVGFMDFRLTLDPDRPESKQRNRFACLAKDGKWVAIHLSRLSPCPDEEERFDEFFRSLKIVENYRQTAVDYFVYGSWCYRGGNYKDAAMHYQAGLDLEKVERTLPEYLWLVTVDNLAMSYGIPGDSRKAREVLDYGLSVRPDYPMFHYNKACTFAEEENLDSALFFLARANELRGNMIPGETMPDPREDSSFRKYIDDPHFKTLLEFWGRDPQ